MLVNYLLPAIVLKIARSLHVVCYPHNVLLCTAAGGVVNDGAGDVIRAVDVEGDPIEYYIPANSLGSDKFRVETLNSSGDYLALLYFKDNVILDREVCIKVMMIMVV